MRLIDLLLVLLFEGRQALPKSAASSGGSGDRFAMLRRMDSTGERTHRQLVDCIRSKDTDALIESIDSGASSIDYMDDVGQTLLNWAAAFGTQEMVEFLCQKGADVNGGQRSSSLHYAACFGAACFGRPQIAQVLLRFGANPDLRDEDGKTPLDKAREGNNEGHREVANILQSPADWIGLAGAETEEEESLPSSLPEVTASTEAAAAPGEAISEATPVEPSPGTDSSTAKEEKPSEATTPTPTPTATPEHGVKGDPEMVLRYVRSLLPMFSRSYQSTMIQSVKKSSLGLIKKMVLYLTPGLLGQVCDEDPGSRRWSFT